MRIRRWLRGPAWAVAILLGIAASADAQLFPNMPTRNRTRTDCALEKPVFGQYRQQFYGYYPTCWRRFPTGWGCPTPEAPNWEAELAKRPLDVPDQDALKGLGDDLLGDGGAADDPMGGVDLPPVPRGRSIFEMDQPGTGAPGAGGATAPDNGPPPIRPLGEPPAIPPAGGAPRPDPFETPGGVDPFDLPAPGGNGGSVPPTASLPEIAPPAATPRTLEYQPASELDLPALAPPGSHRVLPISNSSPAGLPGIAQPRAGSMAPESMISPAMGPRPGANPGMPGPISGPMPDQVLGPIEELPPGVTINENGELVGTPVDLSGEYVEAPPSRPASKLRGLAAKLFYGRGLRR